MQMSVESSGRMLARLSEAARESTLKRLRSVGPGLEIWRPTPGVMSCVDLARHLLDADRWLFGVLDGRTTSPVAGRPGLAPCPTRAEYEDLLAALEASGVERARRLAGLSAARLAARWHDPRFGPDTALWWTIARGNLDHEIHHRGQVSVYLRLIEAAGE